MTTTSPTLLLDHYLKQLKLPTMLREYAPIAAVCAREDQDHLAFLLRLVERELIEREQRAAQRRIKSARFPVLKTLDTFDFKLQPSINRPLVLELSRGEYLVDGKPRDRQNPPGHRFGPGGLYAGQTGPFLLGYRFGDAVTRVPRGSPAGTIPETSRETASDCFG